MQALASRIRGSERPTPLTRRASPEYPLGDRAGALALPPHARSGDDDGRGADADRLLKHARCRHGKELRQGQHTLGGADMYMHGKLRERGGVRMVGEEDERRGAHHAGENGSAKVGM